MKTLHTEIEIAAPAERVWANLTDGSAYGSWNPFITRLSGVLTPGSRLSIRLEPSGGSAMGFQPTVVVFNPNMELRWIGRLLMPGIFDGEHRFAIEPIGAERVRFVQEERFTGLLVPFLARSLNQHTRAGFESMNAALKARSEVLLPTGPAAMTEAR